MSKDRSSVLALSGGVGGAKLALGLSHVVAPEALTVVANTGDDFEHLGLHVSPDIDTVLYTLAGLSDAEKGWGRSAESWSFMAAMRELGGETWFQLGDKDLAVHLTRSEQLRAGASLSTVTDRLRKRFGIGPQVVPMSDDLVRTIVRTGSSELAFQEYFVRHRCEPVVTAIRFEGVRDAKPAEAFSDALLDPHAGAIIICPSNPFLSIDPILAIPGVREALGAAAAPVVAVSPVVAARALKGPTTKLMAELGLPQDAAAVAAHYEGLLDGFVLDASDRSLADDIAATGPAVHVCNTVMRSLEDRIGLANETLGFAQQLRARGIRASRQARA